MVFSHWPCWHFIDRFQFVRVGRERGKNESQEWQENLLEFSKGTLSIRQQLHVCTRFGFASAGGCASGINSSNTITTDKASGNITPASQWFTTEWPENGQEAPGSESDFDAKQEGYEPLSSDKVFGIIQSNWQGSSRDELNIFIPRNGQKCHGKTSCDQQYSQKYQFIAPFNVFIFICLNSQKILRNNFIT